MTYTFRSRERGGTLAARVQKMRKMARPRTRVCEVVERSRREREGRGRGEAREEGRGEATREDSTTESDDPGRQTQIHGCQFIEAKLVPNVAQNIEISTKMYSTQHIPKVFLFENSH